MDIQHSIAEIHDRGFCVLSAHIPKPRIEACREALWPMLCDHLARHRDSPNRGPSRHFFPMPFEPGCFLPEFFFDPDVLAVVRGAMNDRVVADQFGCDVPVMGSGYQSFHVDFQRPLFAEAPDLPLPPYILNVSFPLLDINAANGPLEIAPTTHRMPRSDALRSIESGTIKPELIMLRAGDVLIRHPWALHRGTPNTTDVPRPLVTVRYVRRWYTDDSRETNPIPSAIWQALSPDQQALLRFRCVE